MDDRLGNAAHQAGVDLVADGGGVYTCEIRMQPVPHSPSIAAPTLDDPGETTPRWNAPRWLLAWYDRHRVIYFVVLALFYVAGFTGRWQPEPDAALYLSIGRNLAQGEGYNYHGHPHALAYPGMPYLLAATFELFGVDVVWPAHVVMLLMAAAALALCYRLVRLHTDRPAAVFLTCLVGMTFTVYRYAFELRNDLPFTVGVLAFLAGWEACLGRWRENPNPSRVRWYDIAMMVGGLALAMVMRPHMWVLLAAILGAGVIGIFKSQRLRRILLPVLGGVLLLVVALWWMDPRRGSGVRYTYEAAILASLTELTTPQGLARMGRHTLILLEDSLAEAAFGHRLGPVITSLVSLLLLGLSVELIRRRWLWGLFIIGTVLMLILVLPAPRYLLPVVPLMAMAWFSGMLAFQRRLGHPWGNVVFITMLAIWVAPNFLKIVKFIGEQRIPALAPSYERFVALENFADDLREVVEPEAWVVSHEKIARVLSYWSDRRVAAWYEIDALDRIADPLYVIEPTTPQMDAKVAEGGLVPGEIVLSGPVDDTGQPRWVLRRLVQPVEAGVP